MARRVLARCAALGCFINFKLLHNTWYNYKLTAAIRTRTYVVI